MMDVVFSEYGCVLGTNVYKHIYVYKYKNQIYTNLCTYIQLSSLFKAPRKPLASPDMESSLTQDFSTINGVNSEHTSM